MLTELIWPTTWWGWGLVALSFLPVLPRLARGLRQAAIDRNDDNRD